MPDLVECVIAPPSSSWVTSSPVTVRTTFLGAHALPPEYSGRADDYIDLLCRDGQPALKRVALTDGLVRCCQPGLDVRHLVHGARS